MDVRREKGGGDKKNYLQGCPGELNNVYLEDKMSENTYLGYNVKVTDTVYIIVAST